MNPQLLVLIVFQYFAMVLSISLHDMAQAWTARRLGDPTAQMLGRLTLNPLAHFDMWGMAIWPAVSVFVFHNSLLLGWGQPVPVTIRNFRRPTRDEVLTIAAGPVAQLLAAIVFLLLLVVVKHVSPQAAGLVGVARLIVNYGVSPDGAGLPLLFPVILFLYFGILVNLVLLVFNLMPLPLLDGGRILRNYLPYNAQRTYDNISMYLMFIGFFFVMWLMSPFLAPLLGLFDSLLLRL